MTSFKSGSPWLITDGHVIDAHGAGRQLVLVL